MKLRRFVVAALFLSLARTASAHRLDEYLQATLISLQKDRVEVSCLPS